MIYGKGIRRQLPLTLEKTCINSEDERKRAEDWAV